MLTEILVLLGGGALCGGAGYLLISSGSARQAEYEKTLTSAERTEGVVIEMRRDHSLDDIFDYPVVRFTTAEGAQVDFEASIRRNPPKHKVGDKVPVYYQRADPKQADIVGTQVFGNQVLIIFGILSLIMLFGILLTLARCLFEGRCPTEAP
jgi:uncharacterized protein DUF3592